MHKNATTNNKQGISQQNTFLDDLYQRRIDIYISVNNLMLKNLKKHSDSDRTKFIKTHIEIYVFSIYNKSLKQGITYDKNITLQKIEDKTLCFLDQLSEYNFRSP